MLTNALLSMRIFFFLSVCWSIGTGSYPISAWPLKQTPRSKALIAEMSFQRDKLVRQRNLDWEYLTNKTICYTWWPKSTSDRDPGNAAPIMDVGKSKTLEEIATGFWILQGTNSLCLIFHLIPQELSQTLKDWQKYLSESTEVHVFWGLFCLSCQFICLSPSVTRLILDYS